MRPAGDVGPYLGNSICIAMAKVGTVVPRCPRIVGEMRIVTDRPTPCGLPGTSGPTLGTHAHRAAFPRNQLLQPLGDLL